MTEKVFKNLLEWLDARYLGEMAAIDNLSIIAKQHIESCSTIKYELRLDQDVSIPSFIFKAIDVRFFDVNFCV